jgi:hypothetical protein
MISERDGSPGFWTTVRVLLRISRKRAAGRRKRAQELLQNRTKGSSINWGGFGFAMAVLFMFILNGLAAVVLRTAVEAGQRVQLEREGKIVVSRWFLDAVQAEKSYESSHCYFWNGRTYCYDAVRPTPPDYRSEATEIAEKRGGTPAAIEQKLRDEVKNSGTSHLVTRDTAPGLTGLPQTGRLPAMVGFFVLVWWGVMLVFQGEGLEMDLQRRRHPMWEWLFSHPVPPGAVFLAELLSPIAANPIYWGAPLFVGISY